MSVHLDPIAAMLPSSINVAAAPALFACEQPADLGEKRRHIEWLWIVRLEPGIERLSTILFSCERRDRDRWEPFRRPPRLPHAAYQVVAILIGHAQVTD
jgi:hypothetical protein